VHSAVQSAMNRRHWSVGSDQLGVPDLVGVLLPWRGPSDLRVDHESGTFAGRIEHEGLRSFRCLLGVENITLVADVDLRLEMRRLEMGVADREHLPEGEMRAGAMARQVRRRHAERIGLDLE